MQTILYNISQVIGVAIIHSLWQGLFVYLGLRLIILLFPQLSSATKHNVAMTALVWITAWFVYTLSNEFNTHTWVTLNTRNKDIFLWRQFRTMTHYDVLKLELLSRKLSLQIQLTIFYQGHCFAPFPVYKLPHRYAF